MDEVPRHLEPRTRTPWWRIPLAVITLVVGTAGLFVAAIYGLATFLRESDATTRVIHGLVALAALGAVVVCNFLIVWLEDVRRWRRAHLRAGRCPWCGYRIAGLPEARCPECGETWLPEDALDPL